MLKKRLVFAAVLVLMTGVLVACGEEDEDEEDSSAGQKSAKAGETQQARPIDAVQVAYKKTVAETSARVKFTMVTSGMPTGATTSGATTPGGPESMEFRMNGEGVTDLTGEKGRMTMSMGPLGDFELRMLEDVMYFKMPQEALQGTQGVKPWIKTDLDSFYEQQYGMGFSEMQTNDPTDPTRQLEALKDVGSVERIGREKVRGAPTTHYRAVMDFEKMAEESGPEAEKAYRDMIEQMGTSELPTDVWIDEQGRARKFAMDMATTVPIPADPAADGAAGGATTEEEIRLVLVQEIYDFGVPVNVSPPPPEKTMTLEEFERQMQRQMQRQTQQQPAA